MENLNNEKYIYISEVEDKTKIPLTTLRFYSNKFKEFLHTKRDSRNRRMFSESDIELLKYITRLSKIQKLSLEDIYAKLKEELSASSGADDGGENGGDGSNGVQLDNDTLERIDEIQNSISILSAKITTIERKTDLIVKALNSLMH